MTDSNARTIALLDDIAEYLAGHEDVRDGEDGTPLPNQAMTLRQEIDAEIARLQAPRPEAALTAEYDPVSQKCRGDCDCSIGQTCKAYLAYKAKQLPQSQPSGFIAYEDG